MIEKPSRNENEYFTRLELERRQSERARLIAERDAAERQSHYMKCPKDGYDLHMETIHGVPVEVCARCHGLWVDAGELEHLVHHKEPGMLHRVFGDLLAGLKMHRVAGDPIES
jgi:hypothetical protein